MPMKKITFIAIPLLALLLGSVSTMDAKQSFSSESDECIGIRGPRGNTGPATPFIPAYGHFYYRAATALVPPGGALPLNTQGDAVSFLFLNSSAPGVEIGLPGTYRITFNVNSLNETINFINQSVGVSLTRNAITTIVPHSTYSIAEASGDISCLYGQVVVSLLPNDQISLFNANTVNSILLPAGTTLTSVSLNIVKLTP